MKTSFLFLMLLISIKSFSQECPCVKTAIIGTNVKASITHNNIVVAMDNATLNLGETINLHIKNSTGKISWYKNGQLISNTIISPTESSEYTVKSTLNGCPDVSTKVQIQVRKTLLDELNNEVKISPNPANNYVTISANNTKIKSVRISNIVGASLKVFQFGKNLKQQALNISGLTTGVYIVTIEVEGNNIITKKLIKN